MKLKAEHLTFTLFLTFLFLTITYILYAWNTKFLLTALATGIASGLLLCLIMDWFKTTIKSEQNIHDSLKLPNLTIFSTSQNQDSYLTNAIQLLETNINQTSPETRYPILLMTGNTALEILKTISTGLAKHYALQKKKTLLVQISTTQDQMMGHLIDHQTNIQNNLEAYISKENDFDLMAWHTKLNYEQMNHILSTLKNSYQQIIIQTQEFSKNSHIKNVAKLVEGAVYILEQNSRAQKIKKNIKILNQKTSRVIGVVLTTA